VSSAKSGGAPSIQAWGLRQGLRVAFPFLHLARGRERSGRSGRVRERTLPGHDSQTKSERKLLINNRHGAHPRSENGANEIGCPQTSRLLALSCWAEPPRDLLSAAAF